MTPARLLFPALLLAVSCAAAPRWTPQYTSDSQIHFPEDYREWVFLSSGSGMTYGPLAEQNGRRPEAPLFDNVFVNPESYRSFLETGRWPDKTMFVLEIRSSEGHASINNGGHFQRDLVGIEAEVKDGSAASGEWTFYSFPLDSGKPAAAGKAFPRTASCYSCHGTNTAVENTFVQFYPVLYDVAERLGTIRPDFRRLPPTTNRILELAKSGGWPAAQTALTDTAQRSPDAEVLSEHSLRVIGSRLMQSKAPDSVLALEWAASRYPRSALMQDGLADAYLAAGNKEASRRATEKALALLDADASLTRTMKDQLSQSENDRLKKLR